MTFQSAIEWTENGPGHSLNHPHTIMNYSASPPSETGATGIRNLLVEGLSTSCSSGSRYDAVFSQLRENITQVSLSGAGGWMVPIFASAENIQKFAPPSIAEKLDFVRDAFGLSMVAVASTLNASRASVYNWLETEPQSAVVLDRIEMIFQYAQEWKKKNPYHYAPGKLMKQKLADGPSMLERLTHEQLIPNEIHEGMDILLELMAKQRQRMDRAKARSANVPADSKKHTELLERLTGSVSADK